MENDNSKITNNQPINPNLENKKAFSNRKEIWGIDRGIFVIAMVISIFGSIAVVVNFGWLMGSITAPILILITMLPLYLIHKEDHIAWLSYVIGFLAPERWEPCLVKKQRKMLLLRWGNNGPVVSNIFKEVKND